MDTERPDAVARILDRWGFGSLEALLARLLDLVIASNAVILGHYNKPEELGVVTKADDSPVTDADHAAHDFWLAGLGALTPTVPVLSEESPPEAIARRRQWPDCWMLDPLDGTREFIARTGEFTTNLALIHEGRPVLGVIAVPCQQSCYVGVPGRGAWRYATDAGSDPAGTALHTRARSQAEPLIVLASSRHSAARVGAVIDGLAPIAMAVERHNAGSAIKFCTLVEGLADVYPRTSPCFEWDVAAGDALVTAAGGSVTGTDGQPLRYNAGDSLLAPRFIAAADPNTDYLSRLGAIV